MTSDFRQTRNDRVVHLVEFPDADVEENQEKEKKKLDGGSKKDLRLIIVDY